MEIAKVYRSFYQISHDFPSSLWGEDLKVLPTDAAIINGTASHALDYDDAMSTVILHPSALPNTVLPIAEDLKSSGKDVITAYAVGTEVMIRLTEIIGVRHYSVGWHSTGTIGTLGATAALVNLYRLDENQCINALAIAGSMAGGLRKNFGTMTKPLHVGLAASHAIQAVQLAKENFTANHDLFGDEGIFHAFTGQTEFFEKKAITTAFGEPFALIESGLSVKKFPCCFGTHRFIQGALELKEAHGLELSAIKKLF